MQLTDSFAIGHVFLNPTGGLLPTNATPFELETITDVSLDYKGKNVELRGQYLVPVDARMADVSFSGKFTIGSYSLVQLNTILFAGTMATGTVDRINADEAHSVPGTSTYTITVTNAAGYQEDLGVSYGLASANAGAQFERVTSVSQQGQYSVNTTSGVYTFMSGDANAPVLISYVDDGGPGASLVIPNNLQGQSPIFELVALNSGQGSGFVGYRFYNCRATSAKILSGKNNDFNKIEIDFSVFCPVGQAVGELLQTAI
jgi:hypothetical protein